MSFLKHLFGRDKAKPEPQKQKPSAPSKPYVRSRPDFPEGDNHVDDPDVKTFEDLKQHYPLPQGFEYRVRDNGVPFVLRLSDGKEFKFLIEAGMLTFDEQYTREDGRIGYETTEVIKLGLRGSSRRRQ